MCVPLFYINQVFLRIILDSYRSLPPLFYKKISLKFIFSSISKRQITLGMSYLHTFCIVSLNLLLIVISNMSLVNPGPTFFKVFYQNVQGLTTLTTINDSYPTLNMTKILEFQSFVNLHKFDIIILNETWLKPCISDNEIMPFNNYKIFRLDRSPKSHPPDSCNPQKLKSSGGGVLIAVRTDLGLNPTIVNSPCKA